MKSVHFAYWKKRLGEEPIENVAKEYAHRHKKKYDYALAFMQRLSLNAGPAGLSDSQPKLVFAPGYIGTTDAGEQVRVEKVLPGATSREAIIYAHVQGTGLVKFDQTGLSVCKTRRIVSMISPGDKTATLPPSTPCPVSGAEQQVCVGVVTEHLSMTTEEFGLVKAFLEGIRARRG